MLIHLQRINAECGELKTMERRRHREMWLMTMINPFRAQFVFNKCVLFLQDFQSDFNLTKKGKEGERGIKWNKINCQRLWIPSIYKRSDEEFSICIECKGMNAIQTMKSKFNQEVLPTHTHTHTHMHAVYTEWWMFSLHAKVTFQPYIPPLKLCGVCRWFFLKFVEHIFYSLAHSFIHFNLFDLTFLFDNVAFFLFFLCYWWWPAKEQKSNKQNSKMKIVSKTW